MAWIKIDDQFSDHPKVIAAGPLAAWLYICGLTYCGRYLTDGLIPQRQLRKLADVDNAEELAARLIEVGLWDEVEDGFLVHDFLDYNPCRAEVIATREARAEAGRRGGLAKARAVAKQKPSKPLANGLANGLAKTKQNSTPSPSPIPDPIPIPEKTLSSASADYKTIRDVWLELFPGRTKPREGNKTLVGKARTRMKATHFRQKWRQALAIAAQSEYLRSQSWFDLGWFLQNDNNYEKCLSGKYGSNGKKLTGMDAFDEFEQAMGWPAGTDVRPDDEEVIDVDYTVSES